HRLSRRRQLSSGGPRESREGTSRGPLLKALGSPAPGLPLALESFARSRSKKEGRNEGRGRRRKSKGCPQGGVTSGSSSRWRYRTLARLTASGSACRALNSSVQARIEVRQTSIRVIREI